MDKVTRIGCGEKYVGLVEGGGHIYEVMADGVCELVVWGGCGVEVRLLGEGAECRVRGLVIGGTGGCCDGSCDVHSVVRHMAPNCKSEQLFRAVVGGTAVAHFRGMIYVAEGAVGTEASQYSNGVMLGDDARVLSDPQMEVYADDVKCNHGATVGGRDEQALFYMRQRGISKQDAERLLLESFCFGVVDGVGLQDADMERIRGLIGEKIKGL